MQDTSMSKLANVLAALGLIVAAGCALAALGAGLGHRFGWWDYRTGLATLAVVFWVAAGSVVVCIVGVVLAAPRPHARIALVMGIVGLVIGAVTAWIPLNLRMTANALPAIHDITTDVADPPRFVRIAALRKAGDHPVTYDGPDAAGKQQEAYPDIAPLVLKAQPDMVFAAAQVVLAAMGLEIDEADATQGRIEATATSLLFGFKDDVVVRIAGDAGTTKVDVRSKSRVGRNDFGMNAKRIREFLEKLKMKVAAGSSSSASR